MNIDWTEYHDDDDNLWLEAPSPFHDDGSHFHWRLKQRLANNWIEWYAAHDSECGGDWDGTFWLSLDEAKAAVEEAEADILREYGESVESDE